MGAPHRVGSLHLPVRHLRRGALLLSEFQWDKPAHWAVKYGARTRWVHGTIYLGDGTEWSQEGMGTVIRPVGSDRSQYAFMPDNYDAAEAAARWAEANPLNGYGYDGAIWQGIQVLQGADKRLPLPWKAKYPWCFEAITDVYCAVGYDVVPQADLGTVLGDTIANSPMLIGL